MVRVVHPTQHQLEVVVGLVVLPTQHRLAVVVDRLQEISWVLVAEVITISEQESVDLDLAVLETKRIQEVELQVRGYLGLVSQELVRLVTMECKIRQAIPPRQSLKWN